MTIRTPIKYSTIIKEDYLFVKVTGHYMLFEVKQMYTNVLEILLEKKLSKVLFDVEDVKGDITTLERFLLAEYAAYEALDFKTKGLQKLAIAFYGKIPPIDPYRFGEIVAKARGLNIKVTTDYNEAIKFLEVN